MEFEAGSVHTAQALITNLAAKEFTYQTYLYFGAGLSPTPISSVTLAAGGSTTVAYSAVMPSSEGLYDVYIDVLYNGEVIAHKKSTEPVTIVISPAVDIGDIVWE